MSGAIAWNGPTRRLLMVAGILLVCGLLVDVAFTRGQVEAKRRLLERRAVLQGDLKPIQGRERKVRQMASAFGAPDLAAAVQSLHEPDPVTYLGRVVASSGLVGREMVMESTSDEGGLRRTRFFLRVQGGYPRIVALVKALENGPRLVSIDALSVERQGEESGLEGRLNVSVFSP